VTEEERQFYRPPLKHNRLVRNIIGALLDDPEAAQNKAMDEIETLDSLSFFNDTILDMQYMNDVNGFKTGASIDEVTFKLYNYTKDYSGGEF